MRLCCDNPDTLGQPGPVPLAVGYEMLWDIAGIILAIALSRAFRGRTPAGRVFWIWLAFQSLGRFLISFLRVDPPGLFDLSQAQLVPIVLIPLPAPIFLAFTRMPRRPPPPSPRPPGS